MALVPSFRSDRIEDAHLQRLVDVLDRQADMAGVVRLRSWVLAALNVAHGERALDIGAGTGSEVAALLALGADAVGVEPNPGMRAVAVSRVGEHFVDGDVYTLPFPDASFDVVRCERVFQHLSTPERAAAEIARVLKPGGRAAVLDSDWGTAIIHPMSPSVVSSVIGALGSANPWSGRRLPGLLSHAGLRVVDIGSQALVQPDVPEDLVGMLLGSAVSAGTLSEADRDSALGELRAGAESGDFHMSVTMFAVLAVRD